MNFLKTNEFDMTPKEMKYHTLYMDIATRVSQMSHAQRRKVGCVIVKDGRIVSMGWNGMPAGWDNSCETLSFFDQYDGRQLLEPNLVTKAEVLHAESNAIAKLARDGQSSLGCTLYTTVMPCMNCAKIIHQSGISHLLYCEDYRDRSGVNFLENTPGFRITHLKVI